MHLGQAQFVEKNRIPFVLLKQMGNFQKLQGFLRTEMDKAQLDIMRD